MATTGTFYGDKVNNYQLSAKWTQTPDYTKGTFDLAVEFFLTTPNGQTTLSYQKKDGISCLTLVESSAPYLYSYADINWNLNVDSAGTYSLGTYEFKGLTPPENGKFYLLRLSTEVLVNGSYVSIYGDIQNDVDRVIKSSIAIFPTTYLGSIASISIIKNNTSSLRHKLTYAIGGVTGDIGQDLYAESSTLTFKWTVPFSLLPLFGDTEIEKRGTLYCETYLWDSGTKYYVGTTQSDMVILLDGNTNGPKFNQTIKDTNSVTLALTGNEKALVRYYSNAYIDTGAKAQSGYIVSQSVICGGQTLNSGSGTINNVETNEFTMSATDSRGLTAIKTVTTLPFVQYSKLTCNIVVSPMDANGNLTFKVNGNCYYGSFGAVSNTLQVLYRYKIKDGQYTNWLTTTIAPTSNNYEVSVTLTGLTYTKPYVVQAKAVDKLATVLSAEAMAVSTPIFDWSKTDFNFNVPVTMQEGVTLPKNKTIYVLDSNGNQVPAFTPKTSTGDLQLGYGNYQQESGSTKIYGNGIDLISSGDITLNGKSFNSLDLAEIGTWQPVCNACANPLHSFGNYFKTGDICVINFFFQGTANSTSNNLYFSGLPFTPDSDYKQQAGGGNCTGYRVQIANHVFCGWSIENAKIYGRTIYSRSSAGSTSVNGYIGATSGTTIYASGTIMYKIAEGQI